MNKKIVIFCLIISTLIFPGCSLRGTGGGSINITLSDQGILVDGKEVSTNPSDGVYAGADIIYYEEGKGKTYGNGSKKDAHSPEEAAQHTVITITKPGTYEVSGRLYQGEIFFYLG